jgi:hypothetical protein
MLGKSPRIVGLGLGMAALLLAASAAADDAKLYRWVDKDGHVHYGDQPAAGNASTVNLRSINSSDSSSDVARAAAADKQSAACKQKGDQLKTYQNASSITETDALGNKHEYTPQEQQQLVEKTSKYMDDNCGGAPAAAAPQDASAAAPAAPPAPAQ